MHYRWHCDVVSSDMERMYAILKEKYGLSPIASNGWNSNKIDFMVVDIDETHRNFEEVIALLQGEKDPGRTGEYEPIMYYPVYTEEELRSAQWLSVRSSFSKVIPVNEDEIVAMRCPAEPNRFGASRWRHEIETGPYTVKSPVKWRRNHFASSTNSEFWLFCDNLARDILNKNQIKGIEYEPVIKQSSGLPVGDLYRMVGTYTIPNGALVATAHTSTYVCEHCGMNILRALDSRSRFGIRLDSIPDDLDYCRTLPIFAGCQSIPPHSCREQAIISQKMYSVIKDNQLDRSLWFETIDVVK